jgi:hypothetical protein
MTEGYPPQWQDDVTTDVSGQFGEGGHETATAAWAATAPATDYTAPATDYTAPATDYTAPATDDTDQGKAGVAKEQAAAVGQGAAQAGVQVASVAKDQAQGVVAEAGSQAKDLLGQARSELMEQAGVQQQRLVQGLHALSDELQAMTQHSQSAGVATDLARQGATRSRDVATWLESREPGSLLSELQGFARQRPAAFLVLAAGAGLAAGRLGRGVKDASGEDSSGSAAGSGSSAGSGAAGSAGSGPVGDYPVGGVGESRAFASSQDTGFQAYSTSEGGL